MGRSVLSLTNSWMVVPSTTMTNEGGYSLYTDWRASSAWISVPSSR
jgi:hypothetical protein